MPTKLLLTIMSLALGLAAAGHTQDNKAPATQPAAPLVIPPAKNTAEALQRWRDMKFGIFIHWGPGVISGQEISWSRKRGKRGNIPAAEYDNLYKKFSAEKFNADEWAGIIADSGARYMVFVTKHHDGFCNWDTAITDYKVTSKDCPLGRDVAKELAAAAAKKGLMLGWYFSQRDWHDGDFENQNYGALAVKIRKQIEELCTKYGPVGVIWFDAKGPFPAKYWDAKNLFNRIYELQPACLINDRCGLPGDFSSAEYKVGAFDRRRPWESCVPIGAGWSWKPDAKPLSFEAVMNLLIHCAGSDGNLLLNVGPHPDGHIVDAEVQVLRQVGRWLGQYGKSIYGTRGGPYRPGPWGAATCRDKTIYLHVQKWPEDGKIALGPLAHKVVASSALTGGKVSVEQTASGVTVALAKEDQKPVDTVIELTLDGPAFDAAK
ncbi:MAG: alpha-L-fucosidase [Planctomycetaceae bacterium]